MDEKQLKFLFDNYGKSKGFKDFNEFKSLMQNEGSRKVFFDDSNKDLGFKDYNDFEVTIGVKKKVGSPVSAPPVPLGIASPSNPPLKSDGWGSNPLNPVSISQGSSSSPTQPRKDGSVFSSMQETLLKGKQSIDQKKKNEVKFGDNGFNLQTNANGELPKQKVSKSGIVDVNEHNRLAKEKGEEHRMAYLWNKITKGIGGIVAGASDNVMDLMTSVLPESVVGGTKQDAMKQWRDEVIPISREFFKKTIGSNVVTQAQEDKYDNEFLTSSVGGVMESLPAILSPKGARAIALMTQAKDAALQSINSTEEGKSLPESTKSIFSYGVGTAQGLLEKYGIDKIFGKQSSVISRKIAGKVFNDLIQKADAPITRELFESALDAYTKTAKQQLINATTKLGKAAAIEFVTGSLQEGSTVFAESLLNKGVGKEIFEPMSFGKGIGRILKSGAQEAIGGLVLGGVTVPFSKVPNYISEKVAAAKSVEDVNMLREELGMEIDRLGIKDEGAIMEINQLIDDYARVNSKIPDTVPDRKKAADKIIEREEVENKIAEKEREMEGVDVAFHPELQTEIELLKERVGEINESLVNPSVGEDAEQEGGEDSEVSKVTEDEIYSNMDKEFEQMERVIKKASVSPTTLNFGTLTNKYHPQRQLVEFAAKYGVKLKTIPGKAYSKDQISDIKDDIIYAIKEKFDNELQSIKESNKEVASELPDTYIINGKQVSQQEFDTAIENAKNTKEALDVEYNGDDEVRIQKIIDLGGSTENGKTVIAEEVPEQKSSVKQEVKRIVEPTKTISEMNSEEMSDFATETRKALKKQDKEFEGKTEQEKEESGYYDIIDDVEDLRDAAERINFIENAENVNDLANSVKSTLSTMRGGSPNEYQLAILNSAKNKAIELGIGAEDLIKKISTKIASEYRDIEDAEFMVRNAIEKLIPKNEPKAVELPKQKQENKVEYVELKSNKDIASAFDVVYNKLGHDETAGLLYNWNESELSEDGSKIKSYVGRDGRYSKGKEGGEQKGGKKGFINWLLSDAPFDEKVYGKDIKNDKEWVGNINKAREAIVAKFPNIKKSNESPTTEVTKPVQQDAGVPEQQGTKEAVSESTEPIGQGNAETTTTVLEKEQVEVPENKGVDEVVVKEGFTEGKELNKMFTNLKSKYGDKKGSQIYEVANRLVNPNKNTIVEIRSNGVVVKEDGKYILKPFGNTDANSKNWTLYKGVDISNQFKEQTKASSVGEVKAEVPAQEKVKQLRLQEQAEYDAMPNPKDEAERKRIYDKYDKLISPLLDKGEVKAEVPKPKEGKYETKAKAIAEKIMSAKVVPDWLKIDDENISTKGSSAEDLKKVLADAVINMGKLLDNGVEFSQAVKESVKAMIDIHGEGKRKEIEEGFEKYYRENEAEVPPPSEPPVDKTKESDGSRKSRKLSLLTNLMGATKVPEHFKKGLKEKGLEYEVSNQAEAQQTARGIIDSIGREQALDAARDGLLDPSVGSAVFGEAINDIYSEEAKLRQQGKTDQANVLAQEWADTSYEYAKISNSGGKWNSQIAYFYKSSPMGVVLRQKQQNAETFAEWFKNKEGSWKEVFEEMQKSDEGKSLIDEEVEKLRKEERKSDRNKRRQKIEKFFDDAKFKDDAVYSTIIPPKIINAGLEGMKQVFLAGESAVNAVSKAIEIISKELGNDNWDKDKFRKEWEEKLKSQDGTTSQKSYEELLKERGQELKRRIDEKDFSAEEYKEKKNLNDAEKAALEEFKKIKEAYDAEKKKSPEWINKKAKQYLDAFRKKISGMTDDQKHEVIRRSIKELSENGALKYEDFKKIIAETIGIKDFSEEQVKKIEGYVEDINKEQDAEDAMVKSPSQKNNEEYIKAREKAIQSQHNLYQLTNKQSDITGTIRAWITGSLLGVPTLVKNVAQNILFQSQLRFPKALVRQIAELGMYGISKALPGSRTYHPKTNLLLAQKGYFGMGKKGIKRGLFLFNKGVQEADYNSRTAYQTNLSPKQAARELKLAKAGELYLNKTEKIDRYIRKSIFARQADFILRAMGLGDNPQRWAAEGSAAIQIARNELGIVDDIKMESFLLSPEKYAYNHFIKEGKSTKEASELSKEIKDRIINQGDESVLQQENVLSKLSSLADQGLKGKKDDSPLTKAGKGIASVGKTLTFPFVKIPANVYWNMLKTVNPQLTFAYAVSQAAVSAKYRREGNIAKANEYMNKSSDNAALAVVGYGMGIAVSSLIANGLVRSSNDKEDKRRETEGERVFGKQNELNLGRMLGGDDYWVDLSWFGPLGTMIDVKARIHEDKLKKKLKGEEVDDSFAGELLDNATYSLSSSLNTLVFDQAANTLNIFTNSGGSALDRAGSTYLTNLTNTIGNMLTGATFTAASKAALPEQARLKGDNVIEQIINNQKQRNFFVRWAFGMPKSRISIWGEPIKNDRSVMGYLGSMLGFEKGSENKFGAILYDDARRTGDNRFFPNPEDNKITVNGNKHELTQKEKDELDIEVGLARKSLVQAFVYDKSKTYDGKTYSQITDDKEKVEALSIIYDLGREIGFNKFISNNSKYVPSETELENNEESAMEKEIKSQEFKNQLKD